MAVEPGWLTFGVRFPAGMASAGRREPDGRNWLFDLLSKVMEKYDALAKSILQSMRG